MELQKKIDAVQEMRLLEDVFFEAVMPDIQPLFNEYVQTGLDIRDMVSDKFLFPEFYNCRYKYIKIAAAAI